MGKGQHLGTLVPNPMFPDWRFLTPEIRALNYGIQTGMLYQGAVYIRALELLHKMEEELKKLSV